MIPNFLFNFCLIINAELMEKRLVKLYEMKKRACNINQEKPSKKQETRSNTMAITIKSQKQIRKSKNERKTLKN